MVSQICLIIVLLIIINEKLYIKAFNPETKAELFANASQACDPYLSPLVIGTNEKTGIIISPILTPSEENKDRIICSWTIRAPKNYKIWIKFKRLSLDSECDSRLSFFDGEHSNSTLIESFCETFSRDFETRKNVVHVLFDAKRTYKTLDFQFFYKHVKMRRKCNKISMFSCEESRECFDKDQICNQQFDCNDGKDEEKCLYTKPDVDTICGRPFFKPKLTDLNRIYSGQKAIHGSWPWTVSIRLMIAEPEGHMCGGVLIDYDWVLTAAHCFHSYVPELWTVHIGRHNKIVDHDRQIIRHVEEIFVHKDFLKIESASFYVPVNDIALIKLKSAVPLDNPFIKPICLPQTNEAQDGRVGYATGWGLTRGTGFDLILKQAMIPIISTNECQKIVPNMRNVINDRIICAGYKEGGDDTCEGDSGGPFVVFNNDRKRWEVIGITSSGSGINCGAAMTPGFYTNVYQFLSFVTETMRNYKLKQF